MQKNEFEILLTPHTKINLKWFKDLNVEAKITKLLKENMGVHFHSIGLGSDYLKDETKAQAKKKKTKRK